MSFTAQRKLQLARLQRIRKLAELTETAALLFATRVFKASVEAKLDALEVSCSRALFANYSDRANAAIDSTIEGVLAGKTGPLTEADLDSVINQLEVKMGRPLAAAEKKTLEKYTKSMYTLQKAGVAGRLKLKPSFDLPDGASIKAIEDEQVYWVGNYYSGQLSERMRASVKDNMLGKGYGRSEAGEILQQNLDAEFGIGAPAPGYTPAVAIPGTFHGTPAQYFQGLAATVRNRAGNLGAVAAYTEAGVATYRIQAVMDERTSDICKMLNGFEFTIEQAQEYTTKYRRAATPEEIKREVGWRSPIDVRRIMSMPKRLQQGELVKSGLQLPPYHGFCRTTVAVVSFTTAVKPPVERKGPEAVASPLPTAPLQVYNYAKAFVEGEGLNPYTREVRFNANLPHSNGCVDWEGNMKISKDWTRNLEKALADPSSITLNSRYSVAPFKTVLHETIHTTGKFPGMREARLQSNRFYGRLDLYRWAQESTTETSAQGKFSKFMKSMGYSNIEWTPAQVKECCGAYGEEVFLLNNVAVELGDDTWKLGQLLHEEFPIQSRHTAILDILKKSYAKKGMSAFYEKKLKVWEIIFSEKISTYRWLQWSMPISTDLLTATTPAELEVVIAKYAEAPTREIARIFQETFGGA